MYLPPHILLSSTDEMKGDPRLKPVAFRPANQLPEPLPDGAHRVISEMTSAKMRKMMQGIVVEGTGKAAALNGYSSAGKTGTAQKIDVATHTYSHTKLVASFAGFAPVSNPAISVTVVIDTPTVGPSKYGAAVSAPVFAEVAQQVLEYLGVPHDQPLKTKKAMQTLAAKDVADDTPERKHGGFDGDVRRCEQSAGGRSAAESWSCCGVPQADAADEGCRCGDARLRDKRKVAGDCESAAGEGVGGVQGQRRDEFGDARCRGWRVCAAGPRRRWRRRCSRRAGTMLWWMRASVWLCLRLTERGCGWRWSGRMRRGCG